MKGMIGRMLLGGAATLLAVQMLGLASPPPLLARLMPPGPAAERCRASTESPAFLPACTG